MANGRVGLRITGRAGRRVRVALALFAMLAAALAALVAPALALLALLVAGALIVWERAALAADLRVLAAAVAAATQPGPLPAPSDDLKLEVADGAWGELCHALNRLLQQRRAEQQLRQLLPTLPAAGAARLAELRPPPEGLPCEVVVLALAHPAALGDPVAVMRDTAYTALHQAQLHDALLARWGEGVVLIFGALGPQGGAQALRGAYQAARAISAAWAVALPAQRPRLTMAAGQGRAVILPGLGLTVVGSPVEQAIALQRHTPGAPLICNEDAYLGLRRLGAIPPSETLAQGPHTPRTQAGEGRPAAFAVPL